MTKKKQNTNTDILVDEIQQLFLNVANRRALQINTEKQNLLKNYPNKKLSEAISTLTVISFHIIDAIGQHEPINSISISQITNIPKGTVSKNISKLLAKNLIIKNSLPNNKKERFFHLTPLGKELFKLHKDMHKRFEEKMTKLLKRYTENELHLVIRFLEDYTKET